MPSSAGIFADVSLRWKYFRKRSVRELRWGVDNGNSNPHPLRDQILSLDPATESEPLQQVTSANSEQVRQNPQPSRKSLSSANAPPIEKTTKGREE
jgi:hypothetical protein